MIPSSLAQVAHRDGRVDWPHGRPGGNSRSRPVALLGPSVVPHGPIAHRSRQLKFAYLNSGIPELVGSGKKKLFFLVML